MVNNPVGRPPNGSRVRERLVQAAAAAIEGRSEVPVTARGIAASVGVSHSLVNYHFGSFDALLMEALALRVAPHEIMAAATQGGRPPDLPRLVHGLVLAWEHPVLGAQLARTARRIVADGPDAAPLVDYLERRIFAPLTAGTGRSHARQVTVVLVGAIFARYILRVGAAAAPSAAEFERTLLHLLSRTD